jgi:hypothetical protein
MPENVVVVRRYFEEVLGGGRLDLVNELVAPDYVDRTARPGRAPGAAGCARWWGCSTQHFRTWSSQAKTRLRSRIRLPFASRSAGRRQAHSPGSPQRVGAW